MRWGLWTLVLSLCVCVPQSWAQKTISNIDDQSGGWGSCSHCAGGQTKADVFWTAPFQTTPSRDGNSRQFYVSSSHQFSNVLFWKKLGAQDAATHFTWDFWVYLDRASLNAQALEYDLFQYVGGTEYMFGSECEYKAGVWGIWNQKAAKWVSTALPCKRFTPSVWHHIVWKVHRTSDKLMHYDSVTLDGVTHTINMTEPSGPMPSGWSDDLGVQWQLDTPSSPLTFNEWIDSVKITIQ